MNFREQKISLQKLRSSYLTSVISISLVLFMLGLAGLLIINARRISNHVKENIGFSVILNDDARKIEVRRITKELDASKFIRSTKEITKEEAAEELKEILGEDFVKSLGYNPLPQSIDVKLVAKYANKDSIEVIKKNLMENYPQVKEISYQPSLVELVNKNVNKISFVIFIFSLLLFFIASALINNTIRLSVYAKRFLINTMQLVGATEAFIRKPFLIRSGIIGLVGALLAILLLLSILFLAGRESENLISIENTGIVFIVVTILGVVLSGVSTYYAVNRYLRMSSDELYY